MPLAIFWSEQNSSMWSRRWRIPLPPRRLHKSFSPLWWYVICPRVCPTVVQLWIDRCASLLGQFWRTPKSTMSVQCCWLVILRTSRIESSCSITKASALAGHSDRCLSSDYLHCVYTVYCLSDLSTMYSTIDARVERRREEELSKHGPCMSVVLCCSFTQTLALLFAF